MEKSRIALKLAWGQLVFFLLGGIGLFVLAYHYKVLIVGSFFCFVFAYRSFQLVNLRKVACFLETVDDFINIATKGGYTHTVELKAVIGKNSEKQRVVRVWGDKRYMVFLLTDFVPVERDGQLLLTKRGGPQIIFTNKRTETNMVFEK